MKGGRTIMKNPIVTITMKDGKVMKAELYPEIAPNTVNNFIDLINKGFYEDIIFHRVIPGFMIQGGCPDGNGCGGPGYSIKGEFSANGFENNLKHSKGVLSMARTMDPDSAGSQFFIMVEDAPHLDGQYASFGKLIQGMDVADEIVNVMLLLFKSNISKSEVKQHIDEDFSQEQLMLLRYARKRYRILAILIKAKQYFIIKNLLKLKYLIAYIFRNVFVKFV